MSTKLQLESIVLSWKQKQTNVTHNPPNYLDLVYVSSEAIHEEATSLVMSQWN